MRVIHIVHGKANPDGHNGISRVVYQLNKHEKIAGIDSEIWAVVDDVSKHATLVRDEFVQVECFPRVRNIFGRHEIIDQLRSQKKEISLVHFHIVWFFDKNIIANALKEMELPFVVTTHGTYSKPHARTGKRRWARIAYERRFLNMAEEIHVITDAEREENERYGYTGRTFLAPNGIDHDEVPSNRSARFFEDSPKKGRVRLLWIGVKRVDKNLTTLLRGIAMLPNWLRESLILTLVGPDHKGYESEVKKLAGELGVCGSVEFLGPVYGAQKYDVLESSDLFILPSENEVFALAMLDAMACGKPCLASHGCGYMPYEKDDFFVGFVPSAQGIAEAIEKMFQRRKDWREMGANGRRVIERELNWGSITSTIIENYRRIMSS